MTDMPARTTQRHSDSASATADPESDTTAPRPTPQYANLFIEPDLPPVTDEPE